MGREVKRVPEWFGWPIGKTWPGYLRPAWLDPDECTACGGDGYSPEARRYQSLWYGLVPFRPEDRGSEPFTPATPQVRERAERNVHHAGEFHGAGAAVAREAARLLDLFNGAWCHHLNQDDVQALVDAGRVKPGADGSAPPAREVNLRSLDGLGHDALNQAVVIEARCEAEGVPYMCGGCAGHGAFEAWPGQEKVEESLAWKVEPPSGEWWQMWENTSEGAPVTPPFETRDQLLDHLVDARVSMFGSRGASREEWDAVIDGAPGAVQIAPGVVAL